MKKKIFSGIAVLAIATVAAFNVNFSTGNDLSDISLANVEALATPEVKGFMYVKCITEKFQNPATGDVQEVTKKTCSGEGSLSCDC